MVVGCNGCSMPLLLFMSDAKTVVELVVEIAFVSSQRSSLDENKFRFLIGSFVKSILPVMSRINLKIYMSLR